MTWTHNQCDDCWDDAHPEGRVPVRMQDGRQEVCCFCGKPTTAGIYVRHDPRTLSCTHPEASQ
jgi:hypothetical protein